MGIGSRKGQGAIRGGGYPPIFQIGGLCAPYIFISRPKRALTIRRLLFYFCRLPFYQVKHLST